MRWAGRIGRGSEGSEESSLGSGSGSSADEAALHWNGQHRKWVPSRAGGRSRVPFGCLGFDSCAHHSEMRAEGDTL